MNDERFDFSAAKRAARTAGAGTAARAQRAGSTAARRVRAWLQLTRNRTALRRSRLSLALMLAGLISIAAALILLSGPLTVSQILLGLGVALGLAAIHLALISSGAGAEHLERIGSRIELGLERLQDVQWELSENEARYRALLDTQENAIVRRDAAGNLTFANRSFLDMFGATGGGCPRQAVPDRRLRRGWHRAARRLRRHPPAALRAARADRQGTKVD